VFIWTAPAGRNADEIADKIALKTVRKGNLTTYHAELPASLWGDAALENGFLFSLLVNDNDGEGRKGWLETSPGLGGTKNASLFRMVFFE
jgi:hypothetical protein